MKQGASEAQALHRAGRERTHLAVKSFFQTKLLGEMSDAMSCGGFRKMVEAAEEAQVLAAGKAGVEADIAAGVITKLAANGGRIENGIVARDLRAAVGGEQQRGENAEERGFARAICAQQRQRFAGTHFEGNPGESDDAGLFEWLEEGTPAAASGWEKLLEGCNVYRGFRHDETYSVSAARRQSVREGKQPRANRKLLSLHSEGRNSPVECKPSEFSRNEANRIPSLRQGAEETGSMVSFADRAEVLPHVLVRFLDKESVLLNLETERYFGLDETGTRMWQVVTTAPNIDAAYQELQNEFDVESELLRLHLTELLGRLVDNGLLQIQPADVGTASAV